MGRIAQENTITFAVNSIPYQHKRYSTNNGDNRLMLYFQGVKLYIPNGVNTKDFKKHTDRKKPKPEAAIS